MRHTNPLQTSNAIFCKISLFSYAVLISLLSLNSFAWAENLQRIQNKWKPTQYIHIEYGAPQSGEIKDGWWSAQWDIMATGDGFVRIRNRWKPNQYLHIEHGYLESGPIQNGWWSAQWKLMNVDGQYSRIQNKWKPQQYLHIENGNLVAGPIQNGWWSAQWKISSIHNPVQKPQAQVPPQQPPLPNPPVQPPVNPAPQYLNGNAVSGGGTVRAGPGLQHLKIGSLREGEPVRLIERTGNMMNGYPWFQIEYQGGRRGFQWGGIICQTTQPIPGINSQCGLGVPNNPINPPPVQPPAGQPQAGLSPAHYQYCTSRYRSYDARTNTYQPYGNRPRQPCVSPYMNQQGFGNPGQAPSEPPPVNPGANNGVGNTANTGISTAISSKTVSYNCNQGEQLNVDYIQEGNQSYVIFSFGGGLKVRLNQQVSGSGFRYSDGYNELIGKANTVTLMEGGRQLTTCFSK